MAAKPPKPADRVASPRHKSRKKSDRGGSMKQAIEALRGLSRRKVEPDQYTAYFAEIGGVGNDRGMAILMATGIEDALQSAIAAHLQTKEDDDRLFGYGSPIGTFDSKIRVGHALGIFGPAAKHDLELIKAIRNTFAHSKIPMDFNTPEMAEAANLLTMSPICAGASTPVRWHSQILAYKKRPRFVQACQGLAHSLNAYARMCADLIPTKPLDEINAVRLTPRPLP
jgi:hypothetical protein